MGHDDQAATKASALAARTGATLSTAADVLSLLGGDEGLSALVISQAQTSYDDPTVLASAVKSARRGRVS